MEQPPEDYLKYLLVWVRIHNIPVNHYTKESITSLGDLVGEVDEVAFDPDKPQSHDYVRVRVFFDVSRPVRRSKVVNLPSGGSIGVDKETGRLKINPEVLQNMREYILASEGGERSVRKERVKKYVRQKTILRLEPPPKITTDVNKDKGIVFNVSGAEEEQRKTEKNDSIDGMRNASRFTPGGVREFQVAESGYSGSSCQSFFECPTGFSAGMVSARSSGYLFLKEWEDVKGLQRG
ncbi:uncharacterized protein LOC106373464 [Brassica napus]|nr:PREDICTED: uncharacterized protein LOC106334538 [Brassica oleracea var. oleracea]XP_013669088.1 uncharacterized protein LOC106373464 [Brassica napus]